VAYIIGLDFHDAHAKCNWPLAIRLVALIFQEDGTLHGKLFSGRIDFFEKIFPVVSKIIVGNTVCLRVYGKQTVSWLTIFE
jgi:hypothetical protein